MFKLPWIHYAVHLVGVPMGLVLAMYVFQSITVWEAILFFLFTILPILDELWYAAIHYADNEHARETTNLLLAGEMKKFIWYLHDKRRYFPERLIHNYPIYCGAWMIWYAALIFDQPLFFYASSGLLTHLMIDIANDHYELGVCRHWVWPFLIKSDVG